MKKAFSFIEVIITTMLLSVVMVSLLKLKSENIHKVNKANELKDSKDYIVLAMDFNNINKKNDKVYIDRLYSIKDDEIRRELKRAKVKIKDKKLDTLDIKTDNISVGITTYSRTYSVEDKIKKTLYSFKLEL